MPDKIVHHLIAPDLVHGAKLARQRKRSRPNLTSVAKQMAKAGLEVARYEVDPDGKISIVTGKSQPEQTNDLDKWMATRHES
jgi:predicted alpha/beta-hydrolase family hydrolase